MKVRDSGMPDEAMWVGFFDPDLILRAFNIDAGVVDLVEFGCGYGTFTLAAARMISSRNWLILFSRNADGQGL